MRTVVVAQFHPTNDQPLPRHASHFMPGARLLDSLASNSASQHPFALGELIMAAPNVGETQFPSLASKVAKIATGLTEYASAADKALRLSAGIAGGVARAGDVGPQGPIIVHQVDSIDATPWATKCLASIMTSSSQRVRCSWTSRCCCRQDITRRLVGRLRSVPFPIDRRPQATGASFPNCEPRGLPRSLLPPCKRGEHGGNPVHPSLPGTLEHLASLPCDD